MTQIKRVTEPIPESLVVNILRSEGLIPESTFRDYIGDTEVHCGDVIELNVDGRWVRGRYELGRSGTAWLVTEDEDVKIVDGMAAR